VAALNNISTESMYSCAIKHGGNLSKAAAELGSTRSTLFSRLKNSGLLAKLRANTTSKLITTPKSSLKVSESGAGTTIEYLGDEITTYEELLVRAEIDLNLFEVEKVITNMWEQAGRKNENTIYKTGLIQIKVLLRRKRDEQVATEKLLAKLEKFGPVKAKIKYPKARASTPRRALEVSIMDPHLGMLCYQPESNNDWDLEKCSKLCMWTVDQLVERAAAYGNFEEIVFPFGNDFMHHDNLNHTTTKGTLQPEGISYLALFEHAISLGIAMVDRLSEVAPVKVLQISGNHDHVSSFTLGHVLRAYYSKDKNVDVVVNPSPYKFWHYGVNLVGFDHGHHVKPLRLAALMANEAKEQWAKTFFREWHLGDQHRKGSGSPVVMEEQGVSIEYLPSLTPPNAWHRLKGFNWQQRGAMAFVWDHKEGPIARTQVNINSYTGRPLGT
jgi:hypothetical protein